MPPGNQSRRRTVLEHTMHCSEFRESHCAFVDDTLAGVELVRMQGHIAECGACAELDARVRRSLMWARSIPLIEPSVDFSRKLEAKLRACREEGFNEATSSNFRAVAAIGAVASLLMLGYMAESLRVEYERVHGRTHGTPVARDVVLSPVVAMGHGSAAGPAATPAAKRISLTDGAVAVAPTASAGRRSAGSAGRNTLPPAEIVSGSGRGVVPVSGNEPVAPEIIASVSAGMPIWPAALFAEQAPLHYAGLRKTVH